jgi:hypothetical protein
LSKETKFFSQSSQTGWGKKKEREKRERERERKRERETERERERERERGCVSVCPGFFSADHPQKAAREYGEPAGGGNQGYGVRAGVKTR